MKVLDIELAEGRRVPWGWGIAWPRWNRAAFVILPVPLNWAARWIRSIYFVLIGTRKRMGWVDRQVEIALQRHLALYRDQVEKLSDLRETQPIMITILRQRVRFLEAQHDLDQRMLGLMSFLDRANVPKSLG